MLDLNTINNNITDNPIFYTDYLDMEKYTEIKDIIFEQLRDFENLGVNLLDDIEESNIKNMLYRDIIEFTRDNYLNLADKDYILNDEQLKQTANILYTFICVDCFNVVIPRILEQSDIQTQMQFDRLILNNKEDHNYIKKQIVSNISGIVTSILKIQKFDIQIADDIKFKKFINTFGNYLELIDFSDCVLFTENYLKPILNKYFPQLLWRTLSTVN